MRAKTENYTICSYGHIQVQSGHCDECSKSEEVVPVRGNKGQIHGVCVSLQRTISCLLQPLVHQVLLPRLVKYKALVTER